MYKVLNTWQPIRFVCLCERLLHINLHTANHLTNSRAPPNTISIPRIKWNGNTTEWKAINQIVHLCGFMCVLYTNSNLSLNTYVWFDAKDEFVHFHPKTDSKHFSLIVFSLVLLYTYCYCCYQFFLSVVVCARFQFFFTLTIYVQIEFTIFLHRNKNNLYQFGTIKENRNFFEIQNYSKKKEAKNQKHTKMDFIVHLIAMAMRM